MDLAVGDPDDHYDLFIFAAPDSDATAWGLSYDGVEEALTRVDPEAHIDRGGMALKTDELFWYQVAFPFGWAEGNVGVRHNWLSLKDADLETAAHFAAWLRSNLVPSGAGIEFNFTDGIEDGVPPATLPKETLRHSTIKLASDTSASLLAEGNQEIAEQPVGRTRENGPY